VLDIEVNPEGTMRAVSDEARKQRAEAILRAAREIAERDGWPAVTTRRLSDAMAVSQPVLYSHFQGMADIQAQVALQGFGELTACLSAIDGPPVERLHRVFAAYLAFADRQPAVYDAMFSLSSNLPFAIAETPGVMRAGFQVLADVVAPFAAGQPAALAEVVWSTLHGLVWLERTGRLGGGADERLETFVTLVAGSPRL
jgi:AcrR family transcriptional regulator